ncbi:antibiotic biosynthesis monooxygenase [Pantoea sp. SM3640]|uniref:antibiotic biosynthesis monooxygenase family protein n=1 Tax=Pantoea sp. SM3640 TaxID=2787629 RepID=UPI0018A6F2E6|nr:antibiotic biosynthesis monooxygenase [Pantoea sp. SM3640]QPG28905.1 antibiotic biosynthesis monooxygenase [Pantoea sp. SM3640]
MIAVLFEAEARPEHQMRYLQLAADLSPLLKDIDGFISIERFQSLGDEKKILSLSWWRDDAAVQAWKRNLCHQAAQREGRETLFAGYRIRIATLVREYASQQGVN